MGSRTRLVSSKDQTHTRCSVPLVGCFWGRSHPPLHECRGTLGVFFFLDVACCGPCRWEMPLPASRAVPALVPVLLPGDAEGFRGCPAAHFSFTSSRRESSGYFWGLLYPSTVPGPISARAHQGLSDCSCSAPTLLLLGSSIPLTPSSLQQLPPAGTRLLDPPGCWVQVVGTHGWVLEAPRVLPSSGSPGTPTCGSRAARPEPPCATSLFN